MDRHPVDPLDLRSPKTLWLLLGLALFIRLWSIGYGLPHIYWADEYHEVMRALGLGAGDVNLERVRKGGFYLLLFFEYGVYYVALKLTGIVSNTKDFAEMFVRDPSAFYIMGRVTAALFGSATVAAVFYVARQAFRTSAGLLTALFLAINVLHVDLSHRVGVDVPMALFATLTLYFALRIVTDGRRRDYLLAGLCAALATTTKLPGILLILPLLIAHTYRVVGTPGGPIRWLASRDLWLAAVIFILVLAVTNPGVLLRFDYSSLYSSSSDYPSMYSASSDEMLDENAIEAAGFDAFSRPNLYHYYLGVLQTSMGWPLFALAMLSVGYAMWKHRPADVILVSYASINYLAISSTPSDVLFYPRYSLPIIAVLAVLAGRALSDLIILIPRWRAAAIASLVVVLLAWPFIQVVTSTYVLTQTDTRTLAEEWFETHVPTGSKVMIEGSKTAAARNTAPLADTRESLERRIAYWKVQEPRQAKYLEVRRDVHEGGGYELELVRLDSMAPFDDLTARGVEYFVVRPDYFIGTRKAKSGSAWLLSRLRSDPRVKLLKRFEADSNKRPGPTIEIYRFQPGLTPGS
jgi:4-amino-4-deoxy-L-arabinose transferase-like glycosyltransferase